MSTYDRADATALRMLKRAGKPITFTRTSKGTFDPVEGETTGANDTTATPNGLFIRFSKDLIDQGGIETTDRLLLIDSSHEPEIGESVTDFDGDELEVVQVFPLKPVDVLILSKVQLRP